MDNPLQRDDNSCILAFSCLHAPYQHKRALEFLTALKHRYQPTRVICLGDEVDFHDSSYHESNPQLNSASIELKSAQVVMNQLEDIFPILDIVFSNHGSMLHRKAVSAKIPVHALKSYNDILGVGQGWTWYPEIIADLGGGNMCLFKHQVGSASMNAAIERQINVVQGHYHSKLEMIYRVIAETKAMFGVTAGCLIDDSELAFAYNKTNAKVVKLGAVIIYKGKPIIHTLEEILGTKN